ncbi:MACRO domain containing 1 [Cricetulus griseus]
MSLQSQVSGRLAQLRAAGQLLVAPRPWPGRSAGGPRPRGSACGPPAALGAHSHCACPSAGVGAWGVAGRGAWVRTWAPLAMAAKVDLSTSTDWKEAKTFLKGLSDKQREEHYFCRDFIKLKKIPTWKETAKGVAVKVEDPKYKKDKQLNEKISLFRGDITKLEVDAIVNAEALVSSLPAALKGSGAWCVEEQALTLSVWPPVSGHQVPRPALAIPQPASAGLVRVI